MIRDVVFALILFYASTSVAYSETHVSVEVRSQFVFNSAGEVEAIRQIWLFDDQYSAFAIEGLAKDREHVSSEMLLPLAKTNVESLKDFKYFTYLNVDGTNIDFLDPHEYSLEQQADNRIVLRFTLPLKIFVRPQVAILKTYDPTGFVDFEYPNQNVVTLVRAPSMCETRLRVTKPSGSMREGSPDSLADKIVLACSNEGVGKLKAEDQEIRDAESPSASASASNDAGPAPGEDYPSPPPESFKEQPHAATSKCSEAATVETIKNLEGAHSPVLKLYEKMGAKVETSIDAIRTVSSSGSGYLCEARLTFEVINLNDSAKEAPSGNDDLSRAVQELEDAHNKKVTEIAYKIEITDEGRDYVTLLPNGIDPSKEFQQNR